MTGTKGTKGARRVSRNLKESHNLPSTNFRLPPNIHTLASISLHFFHIHSRSNTISLSGLF